MLRLFTNGKIINLWISIVPLFVGPDGHAGVEYASCFNSCISRLSKGDRIETGKHHGSNPSIARMSFAQVTEYFLVPG